MMTRTLSPLLDAMLEDEAPCAPPVCVAAVEPERIDALLAMVDMTAVGAAIARAQQAPAAPPVRRAALERFAAKAPVVAPPARVVAPAAPVAQATGFVLLAGSSFTVKGSDRVVLRNKLKALGGEWSRARDGWLVPARNAERARALVAAAKPSNKATPEVKTDKRTGRKICTCGDGSCRVGPFTRWAR